MNETHSMGDLAGRSVEAVTVKQGENATQNKTKQDALQSEEGRKESS